jgi:hypothetical protein
MELKLWPLLYADFRYLWSRPALSTHHHDPQPWKARPDFKRFDWSVVRTEGCQIVGEPKPRMPWRLWIYRKDSAGTIWGRHFDWMWFPPTRWCFAEGKSDG